MASTSEHICADLKLEHTINAINWDSLAAVACKIHSASNATWGQQFSGGYNLVRFLHLDDAQSPEVVARVPYRPVDGISDKWAQSLGSRIASEVATMEYIATHTRIPVPRVLAHNVHKDGGGVGSPYILMTKMEGTPLFEVWNDMEDNKREIILQQVVDILLQLSSLRFDSIGALFKGDGATKPQWYIAPASNIDDPNGTYASRVISNQLYHSALDYWTDYASAHLDSIDLERFGAEGKVFQYAMGWMQRSFIPTIYDTSLDIKGFPLMPGDFHSQNILVTDTDSSSPRITAVIDWEFSCTACTTSFAQYPLFIVDHPAWSDDHPLKLRNVLDQITFNRLMRKAESQFDPDGNLRLSRAYENSYGVYLWEQCMCYPEMFALYDELMDHFFGEKRDVAVDYYIALSAGILKKQTEQFEKEVLAKEEAVEILGDGVVTSELTRPRFKDIVLEHLTKFDAQGKVREWLSLYGDTQLSNAYSVKNRG